MVEAYADQLMDEVFEDIDHGLELAETPLDTPVQQYQPISLQPIQIPPIVMKPVVTLPDPVQPTPVPESKPQRDRALVWFDRLLIGLFITSALATLALWLAKRGDLQRWFGVEQVASNQPAEVTPDPTPTDPQVLRNQEFGQYITQSLDRIEGRIPDDDDDSVIGDALPQASNGKTATLSIPVDPASSETMLRSLTRIANALERVSARPLPLPNTNSATSSNTANRANSPNSAANSTNANSANRAAPLPSVRVPAPVVMAPPPEPPEQYSEPYDDSDRAPSVSESSGEEAASSSAAAKQPATSNYSLVGTLDRGDGGRPAALFEVEGVASWVNLGDSIGGSGWVLVDVVDDNATIERNGESRNVYVGQEF